MLVNDNDDNNRNRRIYVGGIDPSRGLTPKMVLERLQKRLQLSSNEHNNGIITLEDIHIGSCYFQCTIVTNSNTSDTDTSDAIDDVYQKIKSWFHHVTWKGCKLIVDKAKPNFLKRLEMERNERKQQQQQEEQSVQSLEQQQQQQRSRYYKIKRGYGKPILWVDTQPSIVTDWLNYSKIRKRQLHQQQKIKQQQQQKKTTKDDNTNSIKLAQKRSYYNRSIHIRFDANDEFEKNTNNICDDADDSSATAASAEQETDDDSSKASSTSSNNSSESSSVNKVKEETTMKGQKYVWSDDDESTSSSSSSADSDRKLHSKDEEKEKIIVEQSLEQVEVSSESSDEDSIDNMDHKMDRSKLDHEINENLILTTTRTNDDNYNNPTEIMKTHNSDDSSSSNSEIVDSSDHNAVTKKNDTKVDHTTNNKYQWSDDDDDDNSDDDNISSSIHAKEGQPASRTNSLKDIAMEKSIDEFASALNDINDNNSKYAMTDDIDMNNNVDHDDAAVVNLQQDVESNMNILSQLFPELSSQQINKPVIDNEENNDNNENTDNQKKVKQWKSQTTMVRFDPMNPQNVNQFVLMSNNNTNEKKMKDNDSKEIDEYNNGKKSDNESSLDINENNTNTNIYEQGKLEQVFKEVRESTTNTTAVIGSSTAGFSFGFDLGATQETVAITSTPSFSFSFAISDKEKSNQLDPEKTNDITDNVDMMNVSSLEPQPKRQRYDAYTFPSDESELDIYVEKFYNYKDGNRILNDLTEWRNDPEVKERWLKERYTLTQDWKRKHKYAQSKKQQRMR